MTNRVILDLCAGTGAWSQPYVNAGYSVQRIDLPQDVRLIDWPHKVHGILAAPPCTYFCRMRMCRGRPTDLEFREALSIVDACLRLVGVCSPTWWALENPQGYLKRWLGPPQLKFDPWEYGDPWTKRTWLWGNFIEPKRMPVAAIGPWISSRTSHPTKRKGLGHKNAVVRSATAPGFARAFFEANP